MHIDFVRYTLIHYYVDLNICIKNVVSCVQSVHCIISSHVLNVA